MRSAVSIEDKQSFLKWFLKSFRLKKRESTWILKYLLNHEEILENVHFVTNTDACPRSIIMTTRCSDEISFRFSKHHIHTTDAEKAFHDIRLNKEEALYIQLNFDREKQTAAYIAVLEDNPYTENNTYEQDIEQTELLLNTMLDQYKEKLCKQKIDEALDNRDHDAFKKWTDALKKLNV